MRYNVKVRITKFFASTLSVTVIVSVLLSGCATPPKQKVSAPKAVEETLVDVPELSTAESAIQQAEQDWARNRDIDSRNAFLLQAAQDYQASQECGKANIIIANIEPSIEEPFQQQSATLLKSECALLKHYSSGQSKELIQPSIDTMVSWLSNINDNRFSNRKEVLIAHLAALHERWELAANVMAGQLSADSPLNDKAAQNLWDWYLKADTKTRQQLNNQNSVLAGYGQLASIVENPALSDKDRQQSITFWLNQNPNHPLAISVPQGVADYLEQNITSVNKIAVLLPLTGRVQAQGNAIKEGIMSAFFAQLREKQEDNPGIELPQIDFFDTGSFPEQFTSEEINQENLLTYDIVIGPLLREHVATVDSFDLPNSMMVLLNRLDTSGQIEPGNSLDTLGQIEPVGRPDTLDQIEPGNSQSAKVFFALAPEDEAKQLANLMKERGVTTPIIINNNTSISQRMVAAFNEQWLALNGVEQRPEDLRQPKEVTFTDNKSLRIGITDALDVLQSQRRISQVSGLTSEVVHSVTRNRRDVDAFVVFAQPEELELMNPIIEASISLFSERTIPVFASSYSYQHRLNKNSIRDLRNVVFVDMPFLMPEERVSKIAVEVDELWNNPPSSFLRLFAFGYDAFQFSTQMQQLAFFSHTELQGKSGRLTVNSSEQVVRELPSAVVSENQIRSEVSTNGSNTF